MKRNLVTLAQTHCDVLVVGGGIYGACIARDAALRGYSTALVEMEDFGHATSANSMKIVHGGLRYLQQLDFRRMRQSIRERTILMRIAPHLVHALPCFMPTYGHGMKGREVLAAALVFNDLISYDRNRLINQAKHLPRGKVVSRAECLRLFPGIARSGLSGGAVWYDAQMYNSERLTLSFVLSAAESGARVANYVKVTGFLCENDRVTGVEVADQLTGESFQIDADVVVNAAGPWVNQVLNFLPARDLGLGVRFAKAVNVATRPLFGRYAVGIPRRKQGYHTSSSSDGLLFVTPWREQALIGTTYRVYDDDPDRLQVTENDVQDLLDQINEIYPPARLSLHDVIYTYCGLVPVSDVNPRTGRVKRARSYQIHDHRNDGISGLISVVGVKYTTARDVAEKVVDRVGVQLGEEERPSNSASHPLYGGSIGDFDTYLTGEISKHRCGLDEPNLRPLIYAYGSAYSHVLQLYEAGQRTGLSPEKALLKAQIIYAIREEMTYTLSDIIFRRTDIGTCGYPSSEVIQFCVEVMSQELGWDTCRRTAETHSVYEQLDSTSMRKA
jgi:glycerol-3-phosphate dehydrogenase